MYMTNGWKNMMEENLTELKTYPSWIHIEDPTDTTRCQHIKLSWIYIREKVQCQRKARRNIEGYRVCNTHYWSRQLRDNNELYRKWDNEERHARRNNRIPDMTLERAQAVLQTYQQGLSIRNTAKAHNLKETTTSSIIRKKHWIWRESEAL